VLFKFILELLNGKSPQARLVTFKLFLAYIITNKKSVEILMSYVELSDVNRLTNYVPFRDGCRLYYI
jgi:hypothetical protein